MTVAGLVSMVLSLCFVVGLVGWCYYRVLQAPAEPPGKDEPPSTLDRFHSA